MEAITFIFDNMLRFFGKLNQFTFAGAPIGGILIAFVITSMAISVFWRGARG